MLLSKKNRQTLLGPLSRNNPVIVQVLGICSAPSSSRLLSWLFR